MQENMVWECVREFCSCWFEERSLERTIDFLTGDVCFVGTGREESAQGKEQMQEYIRKDIGEMKEKFSCSLELIHQQYFTPELCHVSLWLNLANPVYTWKLRMFLVLRKEADGCWRICSLNVSEPGRSQQGDEHYPDTLVLQRLEQVRQELLNDSIAGGMMGGYVEEGFPFYFVNRPMLDHLGYRDEAEFVKDIDGMITNCMHPEDRNMVDEKVEQQLASGNEYTVEYRMKKRDGSYIWVHDIGRKVKVQDGREAIISVCVDISDTRMLQERIRELYEQELSYFASVSSRDGSVQGRMNISKNLVETYLADPSMALVRVGDRFDQFVDRFAQALVDREEGERLRRVLDREQVLADFGAGKVDYQFHTLRRRTDGQAFMADSHMRTARNPETGDIMLFFYTLDATEQYLQQELIDQLVEQDYDNVIEVDLRQNTHRFISYKKGIKARFPDDVNFQEAVYRMAMDSMEGEDREEYLAKLDFEYMQNRLQNSDIYSFTAEMREDNGEIRVKRYMVFYISRELRRVCLTRSDVTDIVRREQRQREELSVALLAAEQANAAKTNFLSRMSHEIRTPMNAIIGMTTIASQALEDEETVSDCLSKIGISSRFLLSLINDILDMSRIESGKMLLKNEELPTEEFINGINTICYSQAENKGVDYECIVDPTLDDYYVGDAMKLQQVLINILSNAVKFTEPGGNVTFSVRQRGSKKNGAHLRFVINDTGVGMSEEYLPHIFEAFSQESEGTTALYGGTGLGLTISKNIVDLMGGKISVHSIKDVGTEFIVDVTLGVSEREKAHRSRHREKPDFSCLKTLVVDDDVAVCEGAVITLKEMGVKAQWVDSGYKAVNQVRELWEKGIYYDLIMIDWKMPEMDGIETARRIREIVGKEVTIIIMTAYDWASIEREAMLAGVNLLMSKPVFKSSLISAFSKALGEEQEEQSAEDAQKYDFAGIRVLLAEDNVINTEVAVRLLESRGFTVETAQNGLRALEMFSKSQQGYYSAILMDIRMPLMDGLTAATNIRHLSNADAGTIPIIAMTANAFDDDVDKSKAAGMNAHLAKPIEPQRLYQTLYDFIIG